MKHISFFLLLFTVNILTAQYKIIVTSEPDNKPLAGAQILCNKKLLSVTNATGEAYLRTKCREVEIIKKGFYDDKSLVDKLMEVRMVPKDSKLQSIEGVVIVDVSDPLALEILKKVNENFENNSPKSLQSYEFKSYEKIDFDLDEDSIKAYNEYITKRLDSLKLLPPAADLSDKKKKDSLESVRVMKLMGQSKLFLWERATEYLYSQKYGEKINVLDNRISGLQEPIYEMLALRSNRNKIPREILPENRALYRYFVTDTLQIEGRSNFVIRFRPVDKKSAPKRRKFTGYLYIDTNTYAVKKIEHHSKVKSEGSLTSIWTPIDGKWFLHKENFKVKMGSTAFPKPGADSAKVKKDRFGMYVSLQADYFNFKTNIPQSKKDFSGYTMSVENADGTLMNQYRTDSLSAREQNTYVQIDSVGQKYKLDQKAGIISKLLKGKVRFGKVDFDLLQLVKYNKYEGLRLGAGIKTNEKFSRYISPDAYAGYGFHDHRWKGGAGIDVRTTLRTNAFFRAEYYNDVDAAGRFNEGLWNVKMRIMNSGVDLNNRMFYRFSGFKFSYEDDLTSTFTAKVALSANKEYAEFPYNFRKRGNDFHNTALQLTLKYAPFSKSMMTPAGKLTYEQNYPEFYFNYEQAFSALKGDFSYSKFDILAQHQFKTKAGQTGARLYAGIVSGEAPIWHQFAMNGLSNGKGNISFNLTSFLGFATMEGGKYFNDRFVGYYLTHRLPVYFRTFGRKTSSFDLVYKGIIGDMSHPEYHDLNFEKLNKLYQEAGLEVNSIFGIPFNLGFFYRVGPYATANFSSNFAVQLKLNILGF